MNFEKVYFPLSLHHKGKNLTSENLIQKIFNSSNYCALIGIAGSGKTMLMKHAFLQAYDSLKSIPIYIELRDLNSLGLSLTEYVYSIILKNNIKPSTKIVERALSEGGFVFLLDGYDEVHLQLKEKLSLELEHFIDINNKNKFLISSRPGALLETLPRFDCYAVKSLNNEEINKFIDVQLQFEDSCLLADKIKQTISKKENLDYKQYLSNPLLLSMFILTFSYYPELPKSKNKFYWNVFDTLATKHDSINKKGGYFHEKKSKLINEDIEQILKWFCYVSVSENTFNFSMQYLHENFNHFKSISSYTYDVTALIYDLEVAISILVKEGMEYKFPHRTLQDYFMVLFVKSQNEEAKKYIYEVIFKNLLPSPLNQNLHDLCMELDKQAYYKFYVLPLFEKFLNTFTENSTLNNYLKLIKINRTQTRIILKGGKASVVGTSRGIIDFIDIGVYFNITFPIKIMSLKSAESADFIISLINENKLIKLNTFKEGIQEYSINFYKQDDEISKRLILANGGLPDGVEEFFARMKNTYLYLQQENEQERLSSKALVNIHFKIK